MRPTTPLVAILLAAGITACGSSGSSTPGPAKLDAMVTFAKCMRANGVPNFPDPGTNGNGGMVIQARAGTPQAMTVNGVSVNAPAFQKAMQTCHSKLPGGGQPPALSASRRAAMLKFSRCMRTHGVTNFPDPTFGPAGRTGLKIGPSLGLDPNSPTFEQAQKACGGRGAPFRLAAKP